MGVQATLNEAHNKQFGAAIPANVYVGVCVDLPGAGHRMGFQCGIDFC